MAATHSRSSPPPHQRTRNRTHTRAQVLTRARVTTRHTARACKPTPPGSLGYRGPCYQLVGGEGALLGAPRTTLAELCVCILFAFFSFRYTKAKNWCTAKGGYGTGQICTPACGHGNCNVSSAVHHDVPGQPVAASSHVAFYETQSRVLCYTQVGKGRGVRSHRTATSKARLLRCFVLPDGIT